MLRKSSPSSLHLLASSMVERLQRLGSSVTPGALLGQLFFEFDEFGDWTGDWDTADSRRLKADAEADAGFKVDMDQMLEDKKKEEAAAAAAPRRNVHSTDDQSACGKTFISDKSFDDEASLIS